MASAYEAKSVPDIRPTGNRVLIEMDAPETVTSGGVIVPEVAQVVTRRARVVAVGEKVTSVKPGQRVVIQKARGTDLPEYKPALRRLVLEDDVWATEV